MILISLSMFSCNYLKNDSCSQNYIGVFQIDLSLVNVKDQIELIKIRNWSSIQLTGYSNGSYIINTSDSLLKSLEGIWFTRSENFDGDCIGYIKQKNQDFAIPRVYFDLVVNVPKLGVIILPFRRKLDRQK